MSKYDKDDFEDEWNEYDIEEYLEERMERYLERLESDVYHDYYESDEYQKNLNSHARNDAYNELLKTYVYSLESLTKNLKPTAYTVISGSGPAWFYEPLTKKFIKTERGSEVVVVPGEADEQGRVMVRTLSTFLLIPKEEVLELGYN